MALNTPAQDLVIHFIKTPFRLLRNLAKRKK